MICAHFGRDQICKSTQCFDRLATQPGRNLVLANEIQDISSLKWICFSTCAYLRGNLEDRLAIQRKSPRKFNLRLANCDLLEIRLVRSLNTCLEAV